MGEGEKIFVRQTRGREDPRSIRRLHAAMRRYGPARLLYVQPAGEDYASGTVRLVTDGLAIGYHANISGVPWNIAYSEWISLCRNAARLFDEDLALVVDEDVKVAVVAAQPSAVDDAPPTSAPAPGTKAPRSRQKRSKRK